MEKCLHVSKIRPAWDHSILNPEKWMCYICRNTESVWACLSCSNVACGRFNEKHALKHYQESKHPISIEVNEKYVYCYSCDDYVLNDNAAGDIKLLRSALSAIATQKFTDIESRGRRLLRSYSHTGVVQRDDVCESDKMATADWHLRQRLLARVFGAWRSYIHQVKSQRNQKTGKPLLISSSTVLKKRTIIPGVTGLRNLGNTCYMNSVLQVLSHIEDFRDFFLKMNYGFDVSPDGSPHVKHMTSPSPPATKSSLMATRSSSRTTNQHPNYKRQTTMECFQHLMSSPKKKQTGGLNGGSTKSSPVKHQLICNVESKDSKESNISLCGELHGLFRVLWSGKWAQVSPHAFLRAVWEAIPMFKGYAQHDAQEFLCELLDKVQRELDHLPKTMAHSRSQLLSQLFEGQLVSMVTCKACGKVSETFEPYTDLSLEFPNRYQITKYNSRVAEDICHITEMLAKFTEEELLEGNIYGCEKCNQNQAKGSEKIYTEAKKRFLINKLPPVLRLHLKRFRWSGRIHREKISTLVATDEILDLAPFCSQSVGSTMNYELFGVIIHHGRGFGAGHYTAYTRNTEAGSWVNCNDSRMILSSVEEVLTAQSYILFYQAVSPTLLSTPSSSSLSSSSSSSLLISESSSLKSESSTDTQVYSLRSQDTVNMQDLTDDNHKFNNGKSSIVSQSAAASRRKRVPSLSAPPSLTSFDTIPSLEQSETLPILSKASSSSSNSGSQRKKYSLKADGTEVLLGDNDSLDGDTSLMLEDTIQIIDGEISFNFKNSAETVRHESRQTGISVSKRTRSISHSESSVPDVKKPRKLSFQTSSFYASPPSKKMSSADKPDHVTSVKSTNQRQPRQSKGSGVKGSEIKGSEVKDKLNLDNVEKLDELVEKRNEEEAESVKHVKRRKTTFW